MNKLTNIVKLGWVGILASTLFATNTEFGLMGFKFIIGVWCSTKIINEAIIAAIELGSPPPSPKEPTRKPQDDSLIWVKNNNVDNW